MYLVNLDPRSIPTNFSKSLFKRARFQPFGKGTLYTVPMLVARLLSTVGTGSARPRKCRVTTQCDGHQMRVDQVNSRVGVLADLSSWWGEGD